MQETGTRRHFELFDSLRGIAVLSVLAFHIGAASLANATARYGVYTSQLLLGVTIFFLISGFLLYRPYAMAQFAGAQTPATGIYARRRFLRIVPAYWAALTLLAVWPGLEGVFTGDWWVYYGLFQSYRPRFMTGASEPRGASRSKWPSTSACRSLR